MSVDTINCIFEIVTFVPMNNRAWICLICGWLYDEAEGAPEHGIAPGTAWADVPANWTCPECGAQKADFEMAEF